MPKLTRVSLQWAVKHYIYIYIYICIYIYIAAPNSAIGLTRNGERRCNVTGDLIHGLTLNTRSLNFARESISGNWVERLDSNRNKPNRCCIHRMLYVCMYVKIRRHQHVRTRAHRAAAPRQSSGVSQTPHPTACPQAGILHRPP